MTVNVFPCNSCQPCSDLQIKAVSEEVQPLLSEVRDTGLLKEVENLTRSLTQETEDLR